MKGMIKDQRWFEVTTKQSTEKKAAGAGYSLTVKVMDLDGGWVG